MASLRLLFVMAVVSQDISGHIVPNGQEGCLSHPCRKSDSSFIAGILNQFFFVIERTRDLIYLKFVATDFSPKITRPSTGENSGDSA